MSARPKKPKGQRERATREFGRVTEPGTFRIERLLPGPIERVWAYLTDPEKRRTWLAPGQMDLRVGGRLELRFRFAELSSETPPAGRDTECDVNGRITQYDPPHLLSYTWGDGPEASEVTFQLSGRDEDVLLVITNRRLGDRATMANAASGWHAHLALLSDHLNGRVSRPFWTTKVRMEAEYAKRIAALEP
jgi:uncharacterized protein YndB with AHSA1/START domain